MSGLKNSQIIKLVNKYIGVYSGYLGDFSYRTHADFYPEYCDLEINPNDYEGTTRQRFITILSSATPRDQAKIIRGILQRCPVGKPPESRTQALHDEFRSLADELDQTGPVQIPPLKFTSEVVERAIADADVLLKNQGATSGLDRIHTVLHGYLLAVAASENITIPNDAPNTQIFKLLKQHHPKLQDLGPRSDDILLVLRACGTVMDVFNPIRNKLSVAHPNPSLLGRDEAMLVINAARTILHYLDSKFVAVLAKCENG